MVGEKIQIWREEEYHYPAAYGFVPFMVSYIHEDTQIHPGMVIVPGGAYRGVASSEGHIVAEEFYRAGYNVFVLVYTVNPLDDPLKLQPLNDISRAVRIVRKREEELHIDSGRIAVCVFSAGGHLTASLCVHSGDIEDQDPVYQELSNRPDAAVLSYPVITSGKYAHRDSMVALLGEDAGEDELEYMSLEKHVTKDTPPCFIWQTLTDETVPVENSGLFADACKKAGVPFAYHVFSDGVHGLSLATQQWLDRDFGHPYTREQFRFLADAVMRGDTKYSPDKGEELLAAAGLDGKKKEKWTPEQKEQIEKTLEEVGIWPKMAQVWLKKQWRELAGEK